MRNIFFVLLTLFMVSCGSDKPSSPEGLVVEVYVSGDYKIKSGASWSSGEMLTFNNSASGDVRNRAGSTSSYKLQDSNGDEILSILLKATLDSSDKLAISGSVSSIGSFRVEYLGFKNGDNVIEQVYDGGEVVISEEFQLISVYDDQ